MGFQPERVNITGMMVLYNNVLQSLYRSQILTLGVVKTPNITIMAAKTTPSVCIVTRY